MESVRLPFLESILPEGVERGRAIGAFFSPASEWQLVVTAIVASRLQANLRAGIVTTMRFPREIYADVARFGVDIEKALKAGLFRIADWYTCITGGVPSEAPEDMAVSLKVADLRVITHKFWHLRKGMTPESDPDFVEFVLFDNLARLFRHNEETACINFLNTAIARIKQDTRVGIYAFATGVLEKKAYSDLESMFDGILDVRTVDAGGATHTVVRVRSFPHVRHTKGWHAVKAQPNSISLVPTSQLGGDVYGAATSIKND